MRKFGVREFQEIQCGWNMVLWKNRQKSDCEGFWGFFFKILFIFREMGREGERKGKKHQCVCLLHTPNQRPGLQPRHVPWLGIELETFWFTGQCSIYWATPASADFEGFTSNTKSLDFTLKMVCKGVVCILFRNIQAIENGLEGGILGVEIPDRG